MRSKYSWLHLYVFRASKIQFVIHPVEAYLLSPGMLLASVTVTTLLSTQALAKVTISDMEV